MAKYNFSQRVYDARIDAGLTQDELGELVGVSGSTINYYEKNKSGTTTKRLFALSVALQKTADYLLGLDDSKYINVDGLTKEQIDSLEGIINDLRKK